VAIYIERGVRFEGRFAVWSLGDQIYKHTVDRIDSRASSETSFSSDLTEKCW